MRTPKNFYDRPLEDQEWLLRNTWCDHCQEPDLGMSNPEEYEEDGGPVVVGICVRCGNLVRTVLVTGNNPHWTGEHWFVELNVCDKSKDVSVLMDELGVPYDECKRVDEPRKPRTPRVFENSCTIASGLPKEAAGGTPL